MGRQISRLHGPQAPPAGPQSEDHRPRLARCRTQGRIRTQQAQDSRQSPLCWQGKLVTEVGHRKRVNFLRPKTNITILQVQTAEDETERMRAELLRKEQELLELKRLEVEMQINKYKMEMEQVTTIAFFITVRLLQYLSSDLLINEININIIRFNVTTTMVRLL